MTRHVPATLYVYSPHRQCTLLIVWPIMDKSKVQDRCAELRDLIDLGPGSNAEILRKALGTVRALRAAAEWEFPRQILNDVKERLIAWFSDHVLRGDDAELRSALMQDLMRLCASWEAPESGT